MEIQIKELKALVQKALVKAGIPKDQALTITEHAVEAQMAGKPTHGVRMIPRMVEEYGKSSPTKIRTVRKTPVSALLDGGQIPGIVVATTAMDLAISKAKKSGIGIVGGFNTGGIGILAVYLRQAVRENLIGMATCNSTGTVVPYGSVKSSIGTNPIGVGVPAEGSIPIVLDMATSSITFAEIKDALDKGLQVRPNCVVDEKGKPTTDPKAVFKAGVLPFDRSYKGYGLGLVAEVLAGPLVNAKAGWEAVKGSWGFTMIALDPSIMVPLKKFKEDVQKLIDEIKNSPRAEGFDQVWIPGEQSQRHMEQCLKNGTVQVDDNLLNTIRGLASK
jgi:LDH2 family malate/lactate/ureidoglycolate dehydrogenase